MVESATLQMLQTDLVCNTFLASVCKSPHPYLRKLLRVPTVHIGLLPDTRCRSVTLEALRGAVR
jgi:hypothetical protein